MEGPISSIVQGVKEEIVAADKETKMEAEQKKKKNM
jgi:hypothetical protein